MKPSQLSRFKIGLLAGLFAVNTLMLGNVACDTRKEHKDAKEEVNRTKKSTYELYGKNIIYYDFSKISEDSIPNEKISLTSDLENYLTDKYNNPKINNPQRFKEDFWEEALKLGYSVEKFKEMGVKEVIKTLVDIIASRFTYTEVDDKNNWFAKEYGLHLPIEEYFYHGFGDCDKYKDATITAFEIIKELNPRLKNVYLSKEELGGSMKWHAWVSIIIPQKDYVMLSHIDPTFYDDGDSLEASKDTVDAHILVSNDAFKAYFYHELANRYRFGGNYSAAYNFFKESISKTGDKDTFEKLLEDASFTVLLKASHQKSTEEIEWIRQKYESNGFKKRLDTILYRSFRVHSDAKDKKTAGFYKQRLLKECPDSYWITLLKEDEKRV